MRCIIRAPASGQEAQERESRAVISEAVGAQIRMKLFEDPQTALRWIRREWQ